MTLRAWWRRCWSLLGLPGVCGLIAAIASVIVYGVLVQQRQGDLVAINASVKAAKSAPAAPPAPAQRAADFEAQFPQADTLTDWLERIEATSASTGVVVERTDYRVSSDAPAGLARYQIALPVKGTYSQVRAFIAALLEAVPALAVTEVDLKRDSIAANRLDARLSVSVYLRGRQR